MSTGTSSFFDEDEALSLALLEGVAKLSLDTMTKVLGKRAAVSSADAVSEGLLLRMTQLWRHSALDLHTQLMSVTETAKKVDDYAVQVRGHGFPIAMREPPDAALVIVRSTTDTLRDEPVNW